MPFARYQILLDWIEDKGLSIAMAEAETTTYLSAEKALAELESDEN